MARSRRLGTAIGLALLLGAASGILLWEPWHGPTILSLSSSHGVDTGDLPAFPLLAVAVAIGRGWAQDSRACPRWLTGRWAGPGSAVLLGVLLVLAGIIHRSDGGPPSADPGGAFDDARAVLLVGAVVWLCTVLASGRARWIDDRRRSWWPPVALLIAGSVVDAVLAPSATLIGPTLVAIWFAVSSSHRAAVASMYLIAAVFMGATVLSLAGEAGLEPAGNDPADARSAALGLLIVTAGALGARYGSSGGGRAIADTARCDSRGKKPAGHHAAVASMRKHRARTISRVLQ
jgi:hypothetical protein